MEVRRENQKKLFRDGGSRRTFTIAVVTLVSLLVVSVALAFGVGNVDGVWEKIEDGGGATCDSWATVVAGIPDIPIDAIGAQVGSTNYPTATDQTLTRKTTVCSGEIGDAAFATWNSSTSAIWTGLGSYTGCTTATSLIFSEYVYDQRSGDDYVGIEIYNGTGAAVALSQYSLRLYTSASQYTTVNLNSVSLANNDVFVLVNVAAAGQTTQEDQTFANSDSYRTVVLVKKGTPSTVTNWSGDDPGVQTGSTTDENQVRYGQPAGSISCPSNAAGFLLQSGFGFDGVSGKTGLDVGTPFYLGLFTHYNNPISPAANPLDWVDLAVSVPVDCDDNGTSDTTFTFYPRFNLDETSNSDNPCKYPGGPNAQGCSDQVLITQPPNPTFTCGTEQYTVNILGFTTNADCQTVYDANASQTEFLTREGFTNRACLWAEIQAPTADAAVDKICTGSVGQDYFVIESTNLGPGTALGAKIVDTLPTGVSFLGYTSKLTVGGFETSKGTCSTAGQKVTCDLNAALPSKTVDSTAKWVVQINVNLNYNQVTNSVTLSTTSNDPNLANNTDSASCVPTAVELSSFAASAEGGAVKLAWVTANEIDNLGFNLYRAEAIDGERVKINPELIPVAVPGSGSGAAYEYVDDSISVGMMYYYWLEDMDISSKTSLHGPVTVEVPGNLLETILKVFLPLISR